MFDGAIPNLHSHVICFVARGAVILHSPLSVPEGSTSREALSAPLMAPHVLSAAAAPVLLAPLLILLLQVALWALRAREGRQVSAGPRRSQQRGRAKGRRTQRNSAGRSPAVAQPSFSHATAGPATV